jgi:hypothetical protein
MMAVGYGRTIDSFNENDRRQQNFCVLTQDQLSTPDTVCNDTTWAGWDWECPGHIDFTPLRVSNGDWKIVLGDNPLTCYDTSGTILWQLEDVNHEQYNRLRLLDSQYDVLLAKRWVQVQTYVYEIRSASTGELIEYLQPYLGELQYTIERPEFAPELVTYESANRTIRVYRLLPYEFQLTISSTDSDQIVLHWADYFSADSYKIYRSSSSSVPFEQMDFVAETDTTYFELTPTREKEFFRVTAVY